MTETTKKLPRTYVNLFGAPLILSSIYFGSYYFLSLFLVISLFCVFELDGMLKKLDMQIISWLPYLTLILIAADKTSFININYMQLTLAIIVLCMLYPIIKNNSLSISSITATVFSVLWIGLFFLTTIEIRFIANSGFVLTVTMFLSVWLCDSAAFIFGKQFGKKKIAPKISPKKTWVGSISGLLTVLLLMLAFFQFNWLEYNLSLLNTILLAFIYGGLSQFGDLFESKLKREAGVKDSSHFLQGHGGFLDRFDSLMITAPAAYFILIF